MLINTITMKKLLIHQDNSIFHLLLLIIFAFGFYSCEFDSSDENYIHIKQPDSEIRLGIDLAGVNPEEVIYVYSNSSLTYTLYTDNKEVLIRQFFLDGNMLDTDQQTGSAILSTDIIDGNIHELKLIVGLKTGSGSLAEHAGLEMYAGEFTFKIKFIHYSDDLNIRETTNNDGNLKLEWDKPTEYEVSGYEIYNGDQSWGELMATIDNPDETSFVDLDYVYGYKHYTIVAKIKNSLKLTVQDNITVSYLSMTEHNFETERISVNKVHIKWKNPNPFPCRYVLTHGFEGREVFIEDGKNEVIIPASDFPTWSDSFSLFIVPKTADIKRYREYSEVPGSYIDKEFYTIDFVGDVLNRKIYALESDSLKSFDINSMKKTSSTKLGITIDTGSKVQISTEGTVAIDDTYSFIHIYSDHSLTNQITTLEAGSYPYHLVSNNKILIEERSGFKIYDIKTNNIICSKIWEASTSNGEVVTSTSVSPDGKYVYVKCIEYNWEYDAKVWTELLEIDNNNITLLEKLEGGTNIESISFNPTKPTKAIIKYYPYDENMFIIVDIKTKEKKEIKGEFMNIDPFTGNLLYKGETFSQDNIVYVLDKTYNKELITLKLTNLGVEGPRLYNNNIFFSARYLNLQNLKEWNQ